VKTTIRSIKSRLKQFDDSLRGHRRILIASHSNPDPDSIVSSVLLKILITSRLKLPVMIAYGGVIGRAENIALIDYAKTIFLPLSLIDHREYDAIALVDAQPGSGNHRWTLRDNLRLVMDHHRLRYQTKRVPFYDVRDGLGATSTLISLYCKSSNIKLSRRQSTMLFYALETETAEMGREASFLDREVYKSCYTVADFRAHASIVNAKVGRDYYSAVYQGIESSVLYGRLIVTSLEATPYPDVVAQLAEYFLKYREVSYAMAMGIFGRTLLFSIRSDDPNARLDRASKRIVKGLGTAGGHGTSAGGQILLTSGRPREASKIRKTIVERMLDVLRLDDRKPEKLVRL
jgi:nanoRNase/pAp phosphatase (c-di-AMP/oligoRNAs hydrolase)